MLNFDEKEDLICFMIAIGFEIDQSELMTEPIRGDNY
jgi:hypothetical protein